MRAFRASARLGCFSVPPLAFRLARLGSLAFRPSGLPACFPSSAFGSAFARLPSGLLAPARSERPQKPPSQMDIAHLRRPFLSFLGSLLSRWLRLASRLCLLWPLLCLVRPSRWQGNILVPSRPQKAGKGPFSASSLALRKARPLPPCQIPIKIGKASPRWPPIKIGKPFRLGLWWPFLASRPRSARFSPRWPSGLPRWPRLASYKDRRFASARLPRNGFKERFLLCSRFSRACNLQGLTASARLKQAGIIGLRLASVVVVTCSPSRPS